MDEFKQKVKSHFEAGFASGWLFFVPLTVFYLIAKVVEIELSIVVFAMQIYLVLCVAGCLWQVVRWLKVNDLREWIFPISIGGLLLMFGPDLEFPSDTWSLWSRPRAAETFAEFRGLGELLNECCYRMLSFLPWKADAKIVGFAWGSLICFQAYRFFGAVGLSGYWRRAAVVGIFLFYGPLGLPYLTTYILGVSAMAMVAQLVFMVELIRIAQNDQWERGWTLLFAVLIAGVNHVQSVVMILMAVAAVGSWLAVNRYGWLRYGIGVLVLAVIGMAAYEFVFLTESRRAVVEGLVADRWITEPGTANFFRKSGEAQAYLGVLGMFNLLAAIYLIHKQRLIGWLTVVPVLALLYPPFVGMFYWALSQYNSLYVVNRVFLLTPPYLSVLILMQILYCSQEGYRRLVFPAAAFALALLAAFPVWPINGKIAFAITRDDRHYSLEQCRQLIEWVEEGGYTGKGEMIFG